MSSGQKQKEEAKLTTETAYSWSLIKRAENVSGDTLTTKQKKSKDWMFNSVQKERKPVNPLEFYFENHKLKLVKKHSNPEIQSANM